MLKGIFVMIPHQCLRVIHEFLDVLDMRIRSTMKL